MSGKIRELIESARFKESRRRIEPDAERFDNACLGVSFVIARHPENGQRTENPVIWAMPTKEWMATPLVIYYSFDQDRVILEDVQVATATLD